MGGDRSGRRDKGIVSINYVDRIFLILTLPPTFNDKFTTEVYVVSLTFG